MDSGDWDIIKFNQSGERPGGEGGGGLAGTTNKAIQGHGDFTRFNQLEELLTKN